LRLFTSSASAGPFVFDFRGGVDSTGQQLDGSTNQANFLGELQVGPLLGALITAGLSIDITHVAGNGFSLNSITVNLSDAAVPEPRTLGLVALALGVGGLLSWRRYALGAAVFDSAGAGL
jgi:hypothetical protein